MYLFSLEPIGRFLSTFQKRDDDGALQFAVVALVSFLGNSSGPNHQSSIGKITSADHSATTRGRVLTKFIQVMRERQDTDDALLIRVCDCLICWSDWLSAAKNYEKNYHGLMGSIGLPHSAIESGTAPHSHAYLEVGTTGLLKSAGASLARKSYAWNANDLG